MARSGRPSKVGVGVEPVWRTASGFASVLASELASATALARPACARLVDIASLRPTRSTNRSIDHGASGGVELVPVPAGRPTARVDGRAGSTRDELSAVRPVATPSPTRTAAASIPTASVRCVAEPGRTETRPAERPRSAMPDAVGSPRLRDGGVTAFDRFGVLVMTFDGVDRVDHSALPTHALDRDPAGDCRARPLETSLAIRNAPRAATRASTRASTRAVTSLEAGPPGARSRLARMPIERAHVAIVRSTDPREPCVHPRRLRPARGAQRIGEPIRKARPFRPRPNLVPTRPPATPPGTNSEPRLLREKREARQDVHQVADIPATCRRLRHDSPLAAG